MDEVGRGALAGPLTVGVASLYGLPANWLAELLNTIRIPTLRDSKKLSRPQRERAFSYLENRLLWSMGEVEASEIDFFGLRPATDLAAERALAGLKKHGFLPTHILADAGLHHPFERTIPTEHFIKGDEKIAEITLASIMAKVTRDRQMITFGHEFIGYGFERNVGYGTPQHLTAIRERGVTLQHRLSFLKATQFASVGVSLRKGD